jgi:hypothetical protein
MAGRYPFRLSVQRGVCGRGLASFSILYSNVCRFISFIAELSVHGEPAEVNASALDALLCIELEAVAVEEWPGGKPGMGRNSLGADRTQCRLDALVEAGGNTTAIWSGE